MGYEGSLDYRPDACTSSSKLMVSQVGKDATWKVCVDSSMRVPFETKVKTPPLGINTAFTYICFRKVIFD